MFERLFLSQGTLDFAASDLSDLSLSFWWSALGLGPACTARGLTLRPAGTGSPVIQAPKRIYLGSHQSHQVTNY